MQCPNSAERAAITTTIQRKYAFQNCIGFIDSTLFPLETKPSEYGEDFDTRKGCYAVNAQVICDHKTRIMYFYTGWAG
ncbi:hypothetical protein HDU78_006727, partial [Chytriomyces hyalinus]